MRARVERVRVHVRVQVVCLGRGDLAQRARRDWPDEIRGGTVDTRGVGCRKLRLDERKQLWQPQPVVPVHPTP